MLLSVLQKRDGALPRIPACTRMETVIDAMLIARSGCDTDSLQPKHSALPIGAVAVIWCFQA